MLIATFHDALGAYEIGSVILLAAGLGIWSLIRLARGRGGVLKALCILGSLVLGGGGLAVGGLIIFFGLLVNSCPPDAYECPF